MSITTHKNKATRTPCQWCGGEGYGGDEHSPWTCSECDGLGYIVAEAPNCSYCNDSGEIDCEQEMENYQVIDYTMPCPACAGGLVCKAY